MPCVHSIIKQENVESWIIGFPYPTAHCAILVKTHTLTDDQTTEVSRLRLRRLLWVRVRVINAVVLR